MSKKAIILFSGGLDSTTCLAIAKSRGFDCYALSFYYGQKHTAELGAAKAILNNYAVVDHKIVTLPIHEFGGSALTDYSIEVPDYTGKEVIPSTYVPARNTIFLSMAMGWAEVLQANDIFIGVSSIDYSGYPDCRPEFFNAFGKLARLATKTGVEGSNLTIHTPLIKLSKAETIKEGLRLGVDYKMTITCYRADGEGRACGTCDSCVLRKRGFAEAGISDPTRYMQKDDPR